MEESTFSKACSLHERISRLSRELSEIKRLADNGYKYITMYVNSSACKSLLPEGFFDKYVEAATKEAEEYYTKLLNDAEAEFNKL